MRNVRLFGWGLSILIVLLMVGVLGWKMAQVSEVRAMDATKEHLAASLNALTAEQIAKDQELAPAWRKLNPFVLLRWQQDNYCGELALDSQPQQGCWYWVAAKGWVVYRARFFSNLNVAQDGVHAWQVLAVPEREAAGASAFALELEAVSAEELSIAGFLHGEEK